MLNTIHRIGTGEKYSTSISDVLRNFRVKIRLKVHIFNDVLVLKVVLSDSAALGKIGLASPEVKACLLWALRYEEKEAVRAEACHSLIVLGVEAVDSEDVIDALQERLLVETSELVRQ